MLRALSLISTLTLLSACAGGVKGDADGDGYGVDEDCDDANASVNPGAAELCDGEDQDCDGVADNGLLSERYPDGDADGYGTGAAQTACDDDAAFADRGGDCDDDNPDVHPGVDELCNGIDDDCDRLVDIGPGNGQIWYLDRDADGFGDPDTGVQLCGSVEGYADNDLDCDDNDPQVNPDAEEVCGDRDDDDCDGLPDVGEVGVWYDDSDGDGYGYIGKSETTCEPQAGWVQDSSDCRPTDGDAYPGAEESCNDIDDNCDGVVDEGMDADDDGFRDLSCPDGDDCDDGDDQTFPGAAEICEDGLDTDCDGIDLPCGFYGSYSTNTADLRAYSDTANYYMGLLTDVGDATGDGIPDVLASTLYADGYAGGGILIPGTARGTDTAQNVGFRLSGKTATTYGVGRSIGVSDVDGDGIEDLSFGSPYSGKGGAYVALGPITGAYDLTTGDAYLSCASGQYCGHGGDMGDLDGDGIADLIAGAWSEATAGVAAGAAYVYFGPITADDSLLTGANKITGVAAYDYTGRFVFIGDKAGSDVDGDGLNDALVAAPYATGAAGRYSGIVYLLLGPATISDFGSAGARLLGAGPNGYMGEGAPMGIGDLDGDGYGDVVVGSYTTTTGSNAGAAWGLFGPVSGDVDLHSADITIAGSTGGQHMGSGVALGDINSDGVDELLVGASGDISSASAGGAGYLYLSLTAGTYAPSDAQASFLGASAGGKAGSSVVLEDVNGDGDADVVLGTPGDSTGGGAAGGSISVFFSVR